MYEFSYEKRKASLLCSLQSYLFGDLSSFSNSVSLHLLEQTKGEKEINRRELQNSSSFFNWKQHINCSIWLHWHLFIVYRSFGDETQLPCRESLILFNRIADKEAQVSQGFRAALGCSSYGVALPCSQERNMPGSRGTKCLPQNCQSDQIKILCKLGLILMDFPHLIVVNRNFKWRKLLSPKMTLLFWMISY